MRRIIIGTIAGIAVLAVAVVLVIAATGSSGTTYKIQFDNAFGLVSGATSRSRACRPGRSSRSSSVRTRRTARTAARARDDAGDPAGLRPVPLRRVLPVAAAVADRRVLHRLPARSVRQGAAAGQHDPRHATRSRRFPADLLQNVMRLPYRERLSLIINELGAAVAGRVRGPGGGAPARGAGAGRDGQPAQPARQRLEDDAGADGQRRHGRSPRSPTTARRSSGSSSRPTARRRSCAGQRGNLKATLATAPRVPRAAASGAGEARRGGHRHQPVLENLNAVGAQLDRFFVNLPPFSRSAIPR